MFQYGVEDPYSGYMPPEQYQQALGDLSGSFGGIGAEMAMTNTEDPADLAACTAFSDICRLVVVAPLADTPADQAGIQAGDHVLAVDGESVDGSDGRGPGHARSAASRAPTSPSRSSATTASRST